jgi:sensor histidine kinase YesM
MIAQKSFRFRKQPADTMGRSMKRLYRRLLPLVAWGTVGLVFATQLQYFFRRSGGGMTWRDSLLWELPRWCLWAIFAPFVTKLARLYPVRRQNAATRIVLHTICAAVISLIHVTAFVFVVHLLRFSTATAARFGDLFQSTFALDFHVGIAVYWLILLLRQSSDSEQRMARLQAELTQAQLQALKMQLHPHFLFNTLNSISSYLRKDVEIADEMIGRLGDFLRLTLQSPHDEEIALEQELEFLKQYLDIEKLRFQERLQTDFEIDKETLHAVVPNFLLQPIVENAVRHGIANHPGKGRIRVSAMRKEDHLQITVSDTGPGIKDPIQPGVGLTTTKNRLERMYGSAAQFELTTLP